MGEFDLGYDPGFLGLTVPLPEFAVPTTKLDHPHFSVLHRPDRRLAALTVVNVHGGLLVDVPRRDRWLLDDRIPHEQQVGNELYLRNRFDRGHLVRRKDPVWGETAVAVAANDATFHYTNAAPMVDLFNQGPLLWVGLEDHVLEHADLYDRRLTVFTGPVLSAADPIFRGVGIPLQCWKVVVWLQGRSLAATAFLLDQSELVAEVLAVALEGGEGQAPPLGAYLTYQVRVDSIWRMLGTSLPVLEGADVLSDGVLPSAVDRVPLRSRADVVL